MEKECNCRICRRHSRYVKNVKSLSQEEKDFMFDLYDKMLCMEESMVWDMSKNHQEKEKKTKQMVNILIERRDIEPAIAESLVDLIMEVL